MELSINLTNSTTVDKDVDKFFFPFTVLASGPLASRPRLISEDNRSKVNHSRKIGKYETTLDYIETKETNQLIESEEMKMDGFQNQICLKDLALLDDTLDIHIVAEDRLDIVTDRLDTEQVESYYGSYEYTEREYREKENGQIIIYEKKQNQFGESYSDERLVNHLKVKTKFNPVVAEKINATIEKSNKNYHDVSKPLLLEKWSDDELNSDDSWNPSDDSWNSDDYENDRSVEFLANCEQAAHDRKKLRDNIDQELFELNKGISNLKSKEKVIKPNKYKFTVDDLELYRSNNTLKINNGENNFRI